MPSDAGQAWLAEADAAMDLVTTSGLVSDLGADLYDTGPSDWKSEAMRWVPGVDPAPLAAMDGASEPADDFQTQAWLDYEALAEEGRALMDPTFEVVTADSDTEDGL